MKEMLIIDSDGHVTEPVESFRSRLKEEHRKRPLLAKESWDRSFGGTLGIRSEDPETQLAGMDAEGIDVQVIYPTALLGIPVVKEAPLAVDLARAYNDWLAEFCAANPARLKGVAVVALQDVDAAVKEARRAIEDLGHVAIMMPTNVRDREIGAREFWPFYEAVEALGAGLGLHGGTNAAERMHGRFETFIAVHTVAFPFECMAALTSLIFAGVPEKFPKLRFAVLESACGWLPFLMDKMDEEFEVRGSREAPLLKRKPSEYMLSGRFYYSFELEESMVPVVIERVGAEKLLWASDYPHWDSCWPHTVEAFRKRQDVSEADRRRIFGENPQRFYGFEVPRESSAVRSA